MVYKESEGNVGGNDDSYDNWKCEESDGNGYYEIIYTYIYMYIYVYIRMCVLHIHIHLKPWFEAVFIQ